MTLRKKGFCREETRFKVRGEKINIFPKKGVKYRSVEVNSLKILESIKNKIENEI